ncbi:hypothetical protein P154DRAFT_583465 [Amniculicola lignicola CBS 123094]|uniref:Uncharacterized protein n=1 Tax=Amniculicola lignicola CBS 123094 TaxID=1392246 RepID=A0A6A5VUZ2_9PLEO|nr:hypothetical protein P154DRAFT_583465 [Amniculicola lignicola CBS 123094]
MFETEVEFATYVHEMYVAEFEYRIGSWDGKEGCRALVWKTKSKVYEPKRETPRKVRKRKKRAAVSVKKHGQSTNVPILARNNRFQIFAVTTPDFMASHLIIPKAKATESLRQKDWDLPREKRQIPPRKYIAVRVLLTKEPKWLPSVPFEGKYLATVCKIEVDFRAGQLIMRLALNDWLMKEENHGFYEGLEELGNEFFKKDGGVASCRLQVLLRPSELSTYEGLDPDSLACFRIMEQITMAVGLPPGEFFRYAESIYRAWARIKAAMAEQT